MPAISQTLMFSMTDMLLLYKHSFIFCLNLLVLGILSQVAKGDFFGLLTTNGGWRKVLSFLIIIVCIHASQCLLCMTQQLYNGRHVLDNAAIKKNLTERLKMELIK